MLFGKRASQCYVHTPCKKLADLANAAHLIALEAVHQCFHSLMVLELHMKFKTSNSLITKRGNHYYHKIKSPHLEPKALNPHGNAVTRGGAENDDIYFQGKEAQNSHYGRVLGITEKILAKVSAMTGRTYAPFVYVGHPQAEKVIIAMGSVTETIGEVIEDLNNKGQKTWLNQSSPLSSIQRQTFSKCYSC